MTGVEILHSGKLPPGTSTLSIQETLGIVAQVEGTEQSSNVRQEYSRMFIAYGPQHFSPDNPSIERSLTNESRGVVQERFMGHIACTCLIMWHVPILLLRSSASYSIDVYISASS